MESNTAHVANVYQMSLCASSGGMREKQGHKPATRRAQGLVGIGNDKRRAFSIVSGMGMCALGALGAQSRGCPVRSVRRKKVKVTQGKSGPRRAFQAERLPCAKVITDEFNVTQVQGAPWVG